MPQPVIQTTVVEILEREPDATPSGIDEELVPAVSVANFRMRIGIKDASDAPGQAEEASAELTI